jgi:hypothetical protein
MLPGPVCNRNLAPEASAGHPVADRSPSRSSRPTPPPLADTGALADSERQTLKLGLTDDKHRTIQAYALSLAEGIGETRWLIYSQKAAAVSKAMLGVLVFWISALFFSFGLFSPRNATVITALFISGLSVSAAIFLILEMYSPYGGLIAVSSDPMRAAVMLLGQ